MRRRQFIGMAGGALAWPFAANAQKRMPRIAILEPVPEGDTEGERWVRAFLQGMQVLGWKAGSNVQIDIRWAGGNVDRMAAYAKELAGLQPDLIHVSGTPATAAVLKQTREIPVLFSVVLDPIDSGFVTSLAHPGGNVTGFALFEPSQAGKLVELMKELAPQLSKVAMLFNTNTAIYAPKYWAALEPAAAGLGLLSQQTPYRAASEIEPTILALPRDTGLVVVPDISNQTNRKAIISAAARNGTVAVYGFKFFVDDGGLASYGVDIPYQQRGLASYADKILKGAKPSELPVQLPTKFELSINAGTARTLGLTIPSSLLARADQIVD